MEFLEVTEELKEKVNYSKILIIAFAKGRIEDGYRKAAMQPLAVLVLENSREKRRDKEEYLSWSYL